MGMEFPQTTYARTFDQAFAGMLADAGPRRVEAKINEETVNVVAGIGVTDGVAGVGGFKLLSGAGSKLAGVVVNSFARNPGDVGTQLSGNEAIMPGRSAPLLTEGEIWMVAEEALAVGDPVYIRHTANGAGKTVLGAIRNDNDGGNARAATGIQIREACSAAGVVRVHVSVPVDRAAV